MIGFLLMLVGGVVVTAVVVGVLAWRQRLSAPTLARPVRRPPLFVRFGEAAVLTLIGIAVLAMIVGGGAQIRLSDLDIVKANVPELYNAWLIGLALSIAGLGLVFAVATHWRTSAAAVLMVFWLAGTMWCMGNTPSSLAGLMGVSSDTIIVLYTVAPNSDYPHMRLHVNGVLLGEAPVRMTMKEFLATVPQWTQPPDGLTEDDLRFGREQKGERPWIKFETPRYMTNRSGPERGKELSYYAQAELDGEWGSGYGGGGGGGGGGRVLDYESSLSFKFPKYDARVRQHIEQAAAAGVRVDAAWTSVAETFGNRGWQILREMIAKDARYQPILDQWARLHYSLPEPMTAADAGSALERVAAEAEAAGGYDTRSVAGAAVDLIVAHLDLDWLVRQANDALRSGHGGYSYSHTSDGFSTHRGTDRNIRRPMRHYVLAQAVWRMNERLRAEDSTQPNRIQTEVLPTLVYSSGDDPEHNLALDTAIRLGWPGAFDFLYRHDWARQVQWPDRGAVNAGFGTETSVSGWLLLLLNLEGPQARDFRTRHNYLPFGVADKVVRAEHASVDPDRLRFLFLDNDLGAESLAVKYWPQFVQLTRAIQPDNGYWGLLSRVRYLARMEPNSTPEMYRQALAVTTGQVGWIPVEGLEKDSLLPARQAEIIGIWIEQLGEIAANPPAARQQWMETKQLDEFKKRLDQKRKELLKTPGGN